MGTRKGIILAGGAGTRLFPSTMVVSKQIIPIYDKPMIYYPLSVLMIAGIRDILIISTPRDIGVFETLLKPMERLGLNLSFAAQSKPEGIAQAFLIAEDFLAGDPSCLILGDNLFYGDGLSRMVQDASRKADGATIFGYEVKNPERYGVVTLDESGRATSIIEKPSKPASRYAVTGLYFYDHQVVDIVKGIEPSARGELEITAVNEAYMLRRELDVKVIGRGYAWFDTGTHDSLLDASNFVATIERRQALKIGCIEEIAWRQNWIDDDQLHALAIEYQASDYGAYLGSLLNGSRA